MVSEAHQPCFGAVFIRDTGQVTLLMLYSMLDFPENERDSRKLKKVQELVQRFQDQCRHYVPKQKITYKH